LPRLEYISLTTPGTPTPISAFVVERPDVLRRKLAQQEIEVKVGWKQMRVSCSVYQDMQDIDRLLNARI
jgi:selenocysteine lyase/cysteine desulfurase